MLIQAMRRLLQPLEQIMRAIRFILIVAIALAGCNKADQRAAVKAVKRESVQEPPPMLNHPIFNEAFTQGFQLNTNEGRFVFQVQRLGMFKITSGSIVACDPFICDHAEPFAKQTPVGEFPIYLALAKTQNGDERVALAKISFAEKPISKWELALIKGQDPASLKKGHFFGYGVDSGTGSFMDAAAWKEYETRMKTENEKFSDFLIAEMEKTYSHTRSWLVMNFPSGTAALFSTGYGDGGYPTYWGYDSEGKLVAAITDFNVVTWEEKQSAEKK